MCEYTVIRSNRKKAKLELSPDGLVVKAPYAMTDEQIAQIVREKSDWIAEHTAMIEEALQNRAPAEKLTMDEIRELADRALKVIPERAAYFASLVGVTYTRITIRNQRTRWGSCSSQGGLNFNCLLMLMPPDVMDSVIVHELCHLKEPNHSERFYAEVLRVFPDYRKCEKWLKENGPALMRRMTGD